MTASGFAARVAAAVGSARRRAAWLDHAVRAGIRYDEADGGRLAAAVTYYAFFAAFALVLLGFSVLGYVLDNRVVLQSVQGYLTANLPRLDIRALRDARGTTGALAIVLLAVAGLWWVDALRSSIRAVWRLPQYPGRFLARQAIDFAVLAGLGVLFGASLATASAAKALLGWLLMDAAGGRIPLDHTLLTATGAVLGVAVNALLAVAVLTGLPRLRMRPARVIGPALLIAAGLEVLKTAGSVYIHRAQANPAYRVVASAAGLLVFLNLLNQLILYAAALTATSRRGAVSDVSGTPPPTVTRPLHVVRRRPLGRRSRPLRHRRRAPRAG